MQGMELAALLLTGGASRRMGSDKATILDGDGQPLAVRTANLLAAVADPVLEVGPGRAGTDFIRDEPGRGPLAAVAIGVDGLAGRGRTGAALVVATDLPRLDHALVAWLARHPAPGTVIPVVDGQPQLLCARYDALTLSRAVHLLAEGRRRMTDLIGDRPWHAAGPAEWGPVSATGSFRDADTPSELRDLLAARGPLLPAGSADGHPPIRTEA
jgi:molybdopterin-guanine dinucleotide biosynthesis protein A